MIGSFSDFVIEDKHLYLHFLFRKGRREGGRYPRLRPAVEDRETEGTREKR